MKKNAFNYNVLITGASSGIGAALAREVASAGAECLFLTGRDATRLETVAADCRARGAHVETAIADVRDPDVMRKIIAAFMQTAPIEVVFANAGVATGTESEQNVRATFETSLGGALNVFFPVTDFWRERGAASCRRRQIAFTSSIAGYAPLAKCASYSAAKAALKTWGLALRGILAPEGIFVNVICPGFVRSRITDRNTCPMPFFMEADKAAKIILRGIRRNCGLIAFPWPMRLGVYLLSILPAWLMERVGRFLPAKVTN